MKAPPGRAAAAGLIILALMPVLLGPQVSLAGTMWTADGVGVRTAAAHSAYDPRITPDGSGGAIVTWRDYRCSKSDIHAQRATFLQAAFYFAEGTCRPGFGPCLCIRNPGDAQADAKTTYMRGDAEPPAGRRFPHA